MYLECITWDCIKFLKCSFQCCYVSCIYKCQFCFQILQYSCRNVPSWNRKAPSINSGSVSVEDAGGLRRLSTMISTLSLDTWVFCSKNLHYFNTQHTHSPFTYLKAGLSKRSSGKCSHQRVVQCRQQKKIRAHL